MAPVVCSASLVVKIISHLCRGRNHLWMSAAHPSLQGVPFRESVTDRPRFGLWSSVPVAVARHAVATHQHVCCGNKAGMSYTATRVAGSQRSSFGAPCYQDLESITADACPIVGATAEERAHRCRVSQPQVENDRKPTRGRCIDPLPSGKTPYWTRISCDTLLDTHQL